VISFYIAQHLAFNKGYPSPFTRYCKYHLAEEKFHKILQQAFTGVFWSLFICFLPYAGIILRTKLYTTSNDCEWNFTWIS